MLDARRFARLAKAEWVEKRRGWAWFLGVVVILHFVLVLILLSGKDGYRSFSTDGQTGTFIFGLVLTAPVFAGRYFQSLSRPGPSLLALMRPASGFEKWLLALLVMGVAYPLAYGLVFYLCDVPATLKARDLATQALAALGPALKQDPEYLSLQRMGMQSENYAVLNAFAMPDGILAGVLIWMTTLQAFAVAGSLLFQRMPFLKTMLAGFVVLLVSILLSVMLDVDPSPFLGYWMEKKDLGPMQAAFFATTWLVMPMLLWGAAYLALREREVGR